jgi:hypothetical protein
VEEETEDDAVYDIKGFGILLRKLWMRDIQKYHIDHQTNEKERKSFGILITYKRLMQHEAVKPKNR